MNSRLNIRLAITNLRLHETPFLSVHETGSSSEAAAYDWSDIDPSIFGTLFERGLDPAKRSQLGAHYTDPEKIMMIVRPVIIEPLWREWEAVKAQIEKPKTSEKKRKELLFGFLERLRKFRVLDPACGSGNFLYLALLALKDIEHRVNLEAEAMGLGRQFPSVGPEAVHGIELNLYAAELARVTIWIGEIQWMRKNGFDVSRKPILKPLKNIEHRDALLNKDGSEAKWPVVDATIGNPPFLGDKKMISVLGEAYVETLRSTYAYRVPGGADLVMYWFEKAWKRIEAGDQDRAGFVATQSVRRGASSAILKEIAAGGRIFDAWQDEEWTVDGADVRVSLVCFDKRSDGEIRLDGKPTEVIHADLSAGGTDLTQAKTLATNTAAYIGDQKSGDFDIEGEIARSWLVEPLNPNGRPNADVLRPWANGNDVTGRPSGKWIIDFGTRMPLSDASLYEKPFAHVEKHVFPARKDLRRENHRKYWWIHGEARPGMRQAINGLSRYIATPRVSKYRVFIWLDNSILADSRLVVIARDDDASFGIVHSRMHELWSLRLGGWHGVGNDPQYTPSLGFETFPFPDGLEPNRKPSDYDNPLAEKIAAAAKRLNELRENWLNPPDLVKLVPEVVTGYPDRIVPAGVAAKAELAKRTLTNLYNARPAWLTNAHAELDAAVAAAYGWPADLSDDEILKRLLALNLERSKAQ